MKKTIANRFKSIPTELVGEICKFLDPYGMAQMLQTFKGGYESGVVLSPEHFGLTIDNWNKKSGEIKDWINNNVILALSQMKQKKPELYAIYVKRFCLSQEIIERLIEDQDFGPLYKIVSTDAAFAAICSDGQIRCWGHAFVGGIIPDNFLPQGVTVDRLVSNGFAFAAICSDGEIRCWGAAVSGGYLSSGLFPEGVTVSKCELN